MSRYYATYRFGEPDGNPISLRVGMPVSEDEGYGDTIFVHVDIRKESDVADEEQLVASLRVRRILISKIINEGRDVFISMDLIDQFQHDVYEAVWDDDLDGYKFDDALSGDLLIFEDMRVENTSLPGFNINKILDDMVYQVSGDASLAVFTESYSNFTHFNVDVCEFLPDVGYAKVLARGPLDRSRFTEP